MPNRLAGRWNMIGGILATLLGIIHNAFAPVAYRSGFSDLSGGSGEVFLYMYLATGTTLIFLGIIIMICSRGITLSDRIARDVSAVAGVFLILMGAGAIIVMPGNPISYIMLAIAIFQIISPTILCYIKK